MREQTYRRYDQSFKEGALAHLRRGDRTFGAVARDLGIPPGTLEYWYNADMGKKGKRSTQGKARERQPEDGSSDLKKSSLLRGRGSDQWNPRSS